MFGMKGTVPVTYRIVRAGILKRPDLSQNKCDDCIYEGAPASRQRNVLCREMLFPPPSPHHYWTVRNDVKPFLHKVMLDAMKQRWHELQLEPTEDLMFHDGKTHFEAISLCIPKGVGASSTYGLKAPKLSREQAQALVMKHIDEITMTPVDLSEEQIAENVNTALSKAGAETILKK